MARRRFFVDAVTSGRAHISGNDAHHLTRVLRVVAGQRYELCDSQNVFLAEVEAVQKDLVTFSIVERLAVDQPALRSSLFVSLIRFERYELLLEKATELGAFRIIAIQAERSEKGLDRAALKRVERWKRIVREASEQSRRANLPGVSGPIRLVDALDPESGHRVAFDEDPSAIPLLQALPLNRSRGAELNLLFGPEGGWTERERTAIARANWKPVSLGSLILRTETAVIAALAIVNAAWQSES